MNKPPFKAVAAMAMNRVIGQGNQIPWQLPEDLQWFKKLTMGHTVVFGRKTFEALGRPLPGRHLIVLSRTRASIPGVQVVSSLEQIPVPKDGRDVFIAGGAEVYAQALPLCSDLFLTILKREVQGDKHFPAIEEQFVLKEVLLERPEFRIVHYRNREATSMGH